MMALLLHDGMQKQVLNVLGMLLLRDRPILMLHLLQFHIYLKLLELLVVMEQVVTLLRCRLNLWLSKGDGVLQFFTTDQLLLQVSALVLLAWQGLTHKLKFRLRGLKRLLRFRLLSDLIGNGFQIVLSLCNGGASQLQP